MLQRLPLDHLDGATKTLKAKKCLFVLAEICNQFSVSDRVWPFIAFVVMKDYGIIVKQNRELIIDRKQVKREREKERLNNQGFQTLSAVQALYFDENKR